MSNEATSRGSREEYTELSKLQPKKKVSVFGYVIKAVCAFNKDSQGQPQHESRLWLTDSTTQQPVPFSLFHDKDDDAIRGELREGILVRVHRAQCRESDGGMWLLGKAGVAGMHVVGFDLKDVLNVVCTTSPTFSFTQLHHDKLTELQRHFMQRGDVTDSMSGVFAFRSRLAARLVQDQTYAPSVTFAIKLLDEPLTRGHSSPPVVIKVKDEEPDSKENAAAVKRKPKRKPDVIILDDDEEESAASWRPQSPPLQRPSMKRSNFAQSAPSFSRFPEVVHNTQMPPATAPSHTLSPPPKRPSTTRPSFAQSIPSFRQPEEVVHNAQMPPAAASSHIHPPAPTRPRVEPSYLPPFKNRPTLRSARAKSYFDCMCEVIGVLDDGGHTILRVCDGTMPPKSLAGCQHATPITLNMELETSVYYHVVDVCCYDEHAISAKRMKAYTMHGGHDYGRKIRLLKSPPLIEKLESQLNAVRPPAQSQGFSDVEESFNN